MRLAPLATFALVFFGAMHVAQADERSGSPQEVASNESSSSEAPASSTGPSTPSHDTAAKPEPSETPPPSRSGYAGAGGLYLPIDGGLTALSVEGGASLKNTGSVDAGFGGRIAFGESKYSSAFAFLPQVHIHYWWDHFGVGIASGAGLIVASRKTSGGWDGALVGLLMVASPARVRFGAVEGALDAGILYAVGQSHPAPFVMPSMRAHF